MSPYVATAARRAASPYRIAFEDDVWIVYDARCWLFVGTSGEQALRVYKKRIDRWMESQP